MSVKNTEIIIFRMLSFAIAVGCLRGGNGVFFATRKRSGDVFRVNIGGSCEERSCSLEEPTVTRNNLCVSNVALRKEFNLFVTNAHKEMREISYSINKDCPGQHGHYLSAGTNLETFAVIGSDGVLEVFDEGTESYTTAFIVNQNLVMDETERDRDNTDCSISSVAVMTGNGSLVDIDSSGFSAPVDLLGGRNTHVQVDQSKLSYRRGDYEGRVIRLFLNCISNTGLECIVFKLNGTVDFMQGHFGISSMPDRNECPTTTVHTGNYSTQFWEVPLTRHIMIGAGCSIVILLCLILILIGCIMWLIRSIRKNTSVACNIEMAKDTAVADDVTADCARKEEATTAMPSEVGAIDMRENLSYSVVGVCQTTYKGNSDYEEVSS